MVERTSEAQTITVKINLSTVPDSRRAADLFSRILRAVREQAAEDEQQRKGGTESAA